MSPVQKKKHSQLLQKEVLATRMSDSQEFLNMTISNLLGKQAKATNNNFYHNATFANTTALTNSANFAQSNKRRSL